MRKKIITKRDILEKNKKQSDLVIWLLVLFFGLWLLCLIFHLIKIQIFDPGHYRARGREQHVSREITLRGDIYDRNGIKLATDEIYREVWAHKRSKEHAKDYETNKGYDHTPELLAEKLSPILGMSKSQLLSKLNEKRSPIPLKRAVSKETEKAIEELGYFRDLSVGRKTKRIYPQGNMAAHILGYYNFNADIATGIEYVAQDKLKYAQKLLPIQKTRDGKIIFELDTDPLVTTIQPKGENVTLTIDAAIQHVAEKELFKMARDKNADGGFAIVINPKNGEILAYAVYPYFDPNNYGKATPRQLKNWSLTDVYPPGSTFKPITLASALDLGKIQENTKIYDTCQIKFGKYIIKNSHCSSTSGMITLAELLERSSNVASYNVAKTMSNREFYEQLKKFGFGQKTGIDLPGESSGLLNPPSRWDGGTKMIMSYGYGTSVSAMQMVSAWSALANNGVRVTPHVIKYSPEEAENKISYIQTISPETAKIITRLLAQSVNMGNTTFKMDKYNLAAKTGTSGKLNASGIGYSSSASYSSTIGYFPASDPQVLIYVCVDNARGGNVWGNTVAGPVFKEIAEQTARILNLKPDKVVPTKSKKK